MRRFRRYASLTHIPRPKVAANSPREREKRSGSTAYSTTFLVCIARAVHTERDRETRESERATIESTDLLSRRQASRSE